MNLAVPDETRFELRGRFLGFPIRIHPFFWVAAPALGIRYLADPEAGSLGWFSFWVAAVLACVLLHVLAQGIAARLFGVQAELLLYGLGSQVLKIESIPSFWKRSCVFLAGPFAQFTILGALWVVATELSFPSALLEWGWQSSVATGAAILVTITLYWGLLNVLPIWPLAGGRVAVDLGEVAFGKIGCKLALGVSLITIAVISVLITAEMSRDLENRYDPRYLIHIEEHVSQLLFCFCLWLGSFRALWPDG